MFKRPCEDNLDAWLVTELEVTDECVLVERDDDEDEISVLGDNEFEEEIRDDGDIFMFNKEEILEEAAETVFFILLTKSFSVVDVTKEDVSFKEGNSFEEVSIGTTLFGVASSLFSFLMTFSISMGFSENTNDNLTYNL